MRNNGLSNGFWISLLLLIVFGLGYRACSHLKSNFETTDTKTCKDAQRP